MNPHFASPFDEYWGAALDPTVSVPVDSEFGNHPALGTADELQWGRFRSLPAFIGSAGWETCHAPSIIHIRRKIWLNSRVNPKLVNPSTTSSVDQALRPSTSVSPLMRVKIQKPESFIQEPTSEPPPMAVAR